MKKLLLVTLLLLPIPLYAAQAPWVGADLKGQACAGKGQGYGPFDFTKASDKPHIPIVEQHHLTPNVINHIKGQEGSIPGDLDYTLRAVPNHHNALLSAIRYQLKLNNKLLAKKEPLSTPVECYLQRAIHFSPTDAVGVSLYAYYLKKIGELEKSAKFYQNALIIRPDDAKIEYAYSQLLIEQKQYDKALEYAKKAYKHGTPPPKLKNQLIKLGVWK